MRGRCPRRRSRGSSANEAAGPDPAFRGSSAPVVYVASSNGRTLTPISTATNRPGRPIDAGSGPVVMTVTPDGRTIYVSEHSNAVTPVSTSTKMAGPPIGAGESAGVIAITPNGKTVYVGDQKPGAVIPISTATNKAGRPIRFGRGAPVSAIAVTPDSRTDTWPTTTPAQ